MAARADPADWLDDTSSGPTTTSRHPPPIWVWFLLHGGIVVCWAVFEVVSPMRGAAGWRLDGLVFGAMILVAGAVLMAQGVVLRGLGRGRAALIASGANAFVFAAPHLLAYLYGTADTMFWVIVVYLVIEGALFWLGFSVAPPLRTWGLLMGLVVAAGVALLLVVYAAFGEARWDALDLAFGFMGLVYSIAVGVGALQVRHAMRVG